MGRESRKAFTLCKAEIGRLRLLGNGPKAAVGPLGEPSRACIAEWALWNQDAYRQPKSFRNSDPGATALTISLSLARVAATYSNWRSVS